ncbi:MAG: hypothetical protein ACSHW9_01775 [Salinibacterium amurskyense]
MLFALLLASAIILPLSGIALLTVWDSQNVLSDARPVWAEVKPADEELRTAVDIVLDWQPVPPLLSPNWTGTVTSVEKVPAGGIKTGDPVTRIDGVLRLAAHTSSPFHRALSLGDRGPDAANLNSLLRQLKFEAAEQDLFTWSTLKGVREFASTIGVDDSAQIWSFDPNWVIYLPAEGMAASQFELHVGAPAPVAGAEIIAPTLKLASGSVTLPGAVVAETSNEPTEVDVSLPVVGAIPESARFSMPEGAVLRYAGQELSVDSSSTLSPEAISLLSGSVTLGARSIRALAASRPVAGSVMVPSSAIYAVADGSLCVIRRIAAEGEEVRVTVLSSAAGKSVVTGDLAVADELLIGATTDQRKCR